MSHLHMLRPAMRIRALMAGVLLGTGSVLAGCGGGGGEERDIITRFFSASRMGDRTTAGMIAMVAFDPGQDGTVSNFDVVNITEEQRRPLQMRELADAVAQAQADEQDHSSRMKAYQDENLEAIARVIEAERGAIRRCRPPGPHGGRRPRRTPGRCPTLRPRSAPRVRSRR